MVLVTGALPIGGMVKRDMLSKVSSLLELDEAWDVATATVGGATFVYVSAHRDHGIHVFAMDGNGALSHVDFIEDDATTAIRFATSLRTVTIGSKQFLVAGSDREDGLTVFEIDSTPGSEGTLTEVDMVRHKTVGGLDGVRFVETVTVGGTEFVVASAYDTDGLRTFEMTATGELIARSGVKDSDNAAYKLNGVTDLTTLTVGANEFLFSAADLDKGLGSWRVNSNGTLVNVDNKAGLQFSSFSSVHAVAVGTKNYLVASDFVYNRLVVYDIANNGTLTEVSAFVGAGNSTEDIFGLTSVEIDGVTFLFGASNSRDRLVAYTLSASGTITKVAQFNNSSTVGLNGAFEIEVSTVGDRHFLLVTGTVNDAITVFELGGADDNLTGSLDHDSLLGLYGDDTLSGLDGNDRLYGGLGADLVYGGLGADSIWGDTGADTLSGDDGNDRIQGEDGADSIAGGAGHDTIDGGEGDDAIDGGGDNDSIDGGDGNDSISGGDGVDSVYGGLGNDTIDGGNGNDSLYGGDGIDTIYGGAGTDQIDGDAGADELHGGDGDDTLAAAPGDGDILYGDAGNDSLTGDALDNAIYGGNDHDSISGDSGTDSLYGGSGNDTIEGGGDGDLADGGDGDDSFVLNAGFGYGNTVIGGTGTDTIDLSGIGSGFATITTNLVTGLDDSTALAVVISGVENVLGSGGSDVIVGTSGANTLSGNDGQDNIAGDAGNDMLYGGLNRDTLDGGADQDTIFGGSGNDSITAGDGADSVDGGDGNDSIAGGLLGDHIHGGIGGDTIDGDDGADEVEGEDGNDVLSGGTGTDSLWGGSNDDSLYGGAGADELFGGDDHDHLYGGGGDGDELTGGADADEFFFEAGDGHDRIMDFEVGVDEIDLSASGFVGDFSDLMNATTDVGGDAVIALSATESITLVGVLKASLDSDDFTF